MSKVVVEGRGLYAVCMNQSTMWEANFEVLSGTCGMEGCGDVRGA
jgi:hypothetical protein